LPEDDRYSCKAFGGLNVLYNNAALPQKEIAFQIAPTKSSSALCVSTSKALLWPARLRNPEFIKAGGGVFLATASLGAIMPRGKSIAYSLQGGYHLHV
jgi:hypothetical protein